MGCSASRENAVQQLGKLPSEKGVAASAAAAAPTEAPVAATATAAAHAGAIAAAPLDGGVIQVAAKAAAAAAAGETHAAPHKADITQQLAMSTPSAVPTSALPHATAEDLIHHQDANKVEEASSPLHFRNLLQRAREQERKVVFILFTRSNHDACRAVSQVFASQSGRHPSVPFIEVNPDKCLVPMDSLEAEFGVQQVPCLVALEDFTVAGQWAEAHEGTALAFLDQHAALADAPPPPPA